MHHTKHPNGLGYLACLALTMLLISCRPLRLAQDFDEISERRIVSLQEKFSRFFVRMEKYAGNPEASIVKYMDFYEDVRTDIDVLQARNRAIPMSSTTEEQLDLLLQEVDQLEVLHSKGFKAYEEVVPLRSGLEGTLISMQKYQFTLKNRVK
jgi:hypothetical protein